MSKLGDKERKKLRRTAFELHLQDDQLIAVGHVATNAWWGWEDSNLQPSGYERVNFTGNAGNFWYFCARSRPFVLVWLRRFIGLPLVHFRSDAQ